jgi:hypothetical protein
MLPSRAMSSTKQSKKPQKVSTLRGDARMASRLRLGAEKRQVSELSDIFVHCTKMPLIAAHDISISAGCCSAAKSSLRGYHGFTGNAPTGPGASAAGSPTRSSIERKKKHDNEQTEDCRSRRGCRGGD